MVDAVSLRKQSAGDILATMQRLVGKAVVIMSDQFAAKLEAELRAVPWDVVVIDEAHKLRNAHRASNRTGQALSGKQRLTFVDPKGLRNLDLSHPKLGLYKEVKALEITLAAQAKAGEAPLVLNAFVLSPTKFADLLNVGDPKVKADLEERNVLFMEAGASAYLKKLFTVLS